MSSSDLERSEMWYRDVYRVGGLLLLAGAFGCDGDDLATPSSSGSLQITTATTGVEMDAGYTVQVDGGNTQTISATASIQLPDINPGDHTVLLDGLAANCTVAGENPRTVSVVAGETATVVFEVNCGATAGGLQVSTTTTGASPDLDGYSIILDGADLGAIAPTGTVTLAALPAGDHVVGLSGIAANCTVGGANPQTVAVAGGASATVSFTVTCAPEPTSAGSIRITTATSGEADPDGYSVALDGATQAIGVSSTVTLTNVAAGSHSVGLSGLAGNCTLQGPNPQPVAVAAGAIAEVSFAITCSATSGSIVVNVTTSGSLVDPDGYLVKVDGADPGQPVPVQGSTTFTGIPAGNHLVTLTGIAANCSVTGEAQRTVSVPVGGSAEVGFTLTCTATTGSIEVRTTTAGSNPDLDGYTVSIDDGQGQPIGVNATLSVPNVGAGAHTVALAGLAANCTVQGSNPQQVTVTAGASASAAFAISCSISPGSSWTRMNSGTAAPIVTISGSSATNVFAAAQSFTEEGPTGIGILHYDGTAWSTQFTHGGIVWDVWAAATGEAFVLVTPDPFGPIPGPPVLRYDGQQWSFPAAQPPSPSEGDLLELHGIWGTSSTDVFAVGSTYGPFGNAQASIVHYDGIQWSAMEVASGENVSLTDVWGSSATDVYAVGEYFISGDEPPENNRAVILHYDGRTWSEVLREPDLRLRSIWGSSANDVYVVGATRGGNSAVWHYDGRSWSALPIPSTEGLRSVWGSSSRDIYVVATGSTTGELWHFDGTTWREETETNGTQLFDVWSSSANDVFVVGDQGTILHGP